MSAATVRSQLQAFLSSPPITGLEKVYRDQPWIALGGDWQLSSNAGWGAIGWLHLDEESETRATLPAVAGQKRVDYRVGLVVLYQYLIPAQLPDGQAEDAWVGPLDALLDAVKARLRSDPKAGTGPGLDGVIFQQSQDPQDLKISRDLPRRDHGKVWSWQVVEFTVTEIVTG